MKRISLFIFALCIVCVAQAQVGVGYYRSGYGSVQKAQDVGPLSRDGNFYYYHGKSMTEKEMVAFIQKDCERAYNYYKKNQKLEKIGWAMFGTGLGIAAIGGGMCIGVNLTTWNRSTSDAGWSFIIAGAAITGGVGIPIICVGAVRKKNAHKVYNQYCGTEETANNMELKLTSGNNGLGLALSF